LLLSWASEALDPECNSSVDIVIAVKSLPHLLLASSSINTFIVALLAMVIATFSTGIDSRCFQQFQKDEKQAEDDVPYIRRIRPKPGHKSTQPRVICVGDLCKGHKSTQFVLSPSFRDFAARTAREYLTD
ncbi:probable serine incorporator isoform X1, partial [Tanacetum coccineum]